LKLHFCFCPSDKIYLLEKKYHIVLKKLTQFNKILHHLSVNKTAFAAGQEIIDILILLKP